METNQIYTIGHVFSNKIKKAYKIDFLISFLKNHNIKTVLDLRYIKSELNGTYAPEQFKNHITGDGLNYLSRIEETYLFYEVLKNISDQDSKSKFFPSHYYLPLISYLKSLNISHKPVALLFNYWDTKNWINQNKSIQKTQTNLKGGFCSFVNKNQIDINILHLVPKKHEFGVDVFTNQDLYEYAYGSLLDIREHINAKAQTFDNYEDDWQSVGDDEWASMNEESEGAAYWNID